jgi:hypothetical protein
VVGDHAADVEEDRQPSYCSSACADSLITWGLSMMTGSALGSGGMTMATARKMAICGAATPMPLLKTWCSPAPT